jgi:hypothetical protein
VRDDIATPVPLVQRARPATFAGQASTSTRIAWHIFHFIGKCRQKSLPRLFVDMLLDAGNRAFHTAWAPRGRKTHHALPPAQAQDWIAMLPPIACFRLRLVRKEQSA